nr:LOW QUALITY PROTEIN: ly6/PLAUR domain-containing protein 3 [Anolis sagrei ordinatus]
MFELHFSDTDGTRTFPRLHQDWDLARIAMGTCLQLHSCIPFLLVGLAFFMKGALTLECYSCVDRGDGGCSTENIKKVKCPSSTHVCVETVAAVEWSHGKFSVGEKGCGLGMAGTNDKAVAVHGIYAFSQLHQCNKSRCNNKLDIKKLELQPMDNVTARVPNDVECYSCLGDDCSINNSTIVKCYNSYQGCFHGNVTMKAGNFSLTKPIKGCVEDEDCTKVSKGSHAITLVGSCCSGSLCNVDLSNKTHFAAKIPRLEFLPGPDSNANATTSASTHANIPASSTINKLSRSVTLSPSLSSHPDHDHDHDHEHDHGDEEFTSVRNGDIATAVKVEERHNQQDQGTKGGAKGGAVGLGGSVLMVLLLVGLFI